MTYPFALAFGQYPQQGGNMSPFWLAALPFAVLVPRILWRNYRGLLWLTLASVLAVVVWVALRPSTLATRFILPAILALFPFAGLLVEQTWDRRELKWLRFLLPLLLIFMLLDAGTREAGKVYRSANYWIHGEEVASPSLGQAFRNVNDRAAPGDRVIMLTYYSYHLRTDLIQCMLPFLHVADLRRIGQEVTWEDVYRKGARFVVVEESYQTGWPDDSMTIPKWLTIDEIYNDGGWRVLQLSPHNGAPTPEWMCRPDGSVWRVVAFDR
jgi:hypothetical protein